MLDLEIRKQISLYAAEEISSSDLEGWLSEKTWNIDNEPVATQELAYEALRLTSESDLGDWSDVELRDLLGNLSRTYWFKQAPKRFVYSNSDTPTTHHGQRQVGSGTRRALECA
jgi:hypothetical protein